MNNDKRDRQADEIFSCDGFSIRLTPGNQVYLQVPGGARRWPEIRIKGLVSFDRCVIVPAPIEKKLLEILSKKEKVEEIQYQESLVEPPLDCRVECVELGIDEQPGDTNWCQPDSEATASTEELADDSEEETGVIVRLNEEYADR
jgi:hypothetical protein